MYLSANMAPALAPAIQLSAMLAAAGVLAFFTRTSPRRRFASALLLSIPVAGIIAAGYEYLHGLHPERIGSSILIVLAWMWMVPLSRRPLHWLLLAGAWCVTGMLITPVTWEDIVAPALPALVFAPISTIWIALWMARSQLHPAALSLLIAILLVIWTLLLAWPMPEALVAWFALVLALHLYMALPQLRDGAERLAGVRINPFALRNPWPAVDRAALLGMVVAAVAMTILLRQPTPESPVAEQPTLQVATTPAASPLENGTVLARFLAQKSLELQDAWISDPLARSAVEQIQTSESLAQLIHDLDPVLIRSRLSTARPLIDLLEEFAQSDFADPLAENHQQAMVECARLLALHGLLACADDRVLDATHDMKTLYATAGLLQSHETFTIANRLAWTIEQSSEGRAEWTITLHQSLLLGQDLIESRAFTEALGLTSQSSLEWDLFQELKIAVATRQFYMDNKHWPETVRDLKPAYMKAIRRPLIPGHAYYLRAVEENRLQISRAMVVTAP